MPSPKQIQAELRTLLKERADLDKAIRSLEKLNHLRQRRHDAAMVLRLLAKRAA